MANDSSSGVAPGVFDLVTEGGVAQVLAAVRVADLKPAAKNDLRDTIFEYISGGRDESARLVLEKKLATYGVQPVVDAAPQPPVAEPVPLAPPQYPFGTVRPTPHFAPTLPTAPSVTVQTASVPAPVAPSIPVAPPVTEPVVVPPAPVLEEVVVPAPAPSESVVPPVQAPAPQPVADIDPEVQLRRIREIKSMVNERVGNPVNLVDIDNTVGREYLAALLDAMKRASAGQSAGGAMQRLEVAYKAVQDVLSDHAALPSEADVVAGLTDNFSSGFTVPPGMPPVPPMGDTPEESVARAIPLAHDSGPQNRPPIVGSWSSADVPAAPAVSIPSPATAPIVGQWGAAATSPAPSVPPAPPTPPKLTPISALQTQPKSPDVLPDASSLKTASIAGDPLFTKEVDDGLQQLLAEWVLFKKSGFFGTGPKGRQHPLFIQIAPLQIPLLLAGRFEGSTQEIRQSITDYMNGWRYEQGIIYEHDETFEHYLRRVIRHILDLQKPK